LSSIIATAKYLKDNFHKMKPELAQEMLDLLYESSMDELDMLDYIVEWARIKYASDVFYPKKIKLNEYAIKVFESLSDTASKNSVNLINKIEEETIVFADEKMLVSILHNLVSNAIKSIEEKGTVTVSSKYQNDKFIIEVKDNGIGMSKQKIEKIFTPQMKTLSKKRKKNKGAGIGLLLVKGFLEKNSGEIWVESKVNKGTSFYFTLPITKPTHVIGSLDEIMFDESP
jgi:signal transduction histidine kinase